MLWVRDENGTKDPKDDALRLLFGDPYVYLSPVPCLTTIADHFPRSILGDGPVQKLNDVAEDTLGPREDRTPSKANRLRSGESIGGTKYERDHRAKPVLPDTRCFTNAYSHQLPPNILSPAPCLKIGDGGLDPGLLLRQKINHVRCLSPKVLGHKLNKLWADSTRHRH